MGCRVWGAVYRVYCVGCGVLGVDSRVLCVVCGVRGVGCRVEVLGFRVYRCKCVSGRFRGQVGCGRQSG
jgi:hypothetical protein